MPNKITIITDNYYKNTTSTMRKSNNKTLKSNNKHIKDIIFSSKPLMLLSTDGPLHFWGGGSPYSYNSVQIYNNIFIQIYNNNYYYSYITSIIV